MDEATTGSIDDKVKAIFAVAVERGEIDGEFELREHEVFDVLKLWGFDPVNYGFYPDLESAAEESANYESESGSVVITMQADYLPHKTGTGAIKKNVQKDKIEEVVEEMIRTFPREYAGWLQANPAKAPDVYKLLLKSRADLILAILENIQGVLIMDYDEHDDGLCDEIRVGLDADTSYDQILMFSLGGTRSSSLTSDPLVKEGFRALRAPGLLEDSDIPEFVRAPRSLYANLPGRGRGDDREDPTQIIEAGMARLVGELKKYSPENPDADYEITAFEVNPFKASDMRPLDGILRFKKAKKTEKDERPHQNITNMMYPNSVVLAGISGGDAELAAEKVFVKLVERGMSLDDIYFLHPKPGELHSKMEARYAETYGHFDPSHFVESIPVLHETLDGRVLDLLFNAAPAFAVAPMIADANKMKVVESTYTVTAGFGETTAGKDAEEAMIASIFGSDTINAGANTLGNVGHDGEVWTDTMFEPAAYKAIKLDNPSRKVAYVCQSGARGVSLLRAMEHYANPATLMTIGNAMDLNPAHAIKWLGETHKDTPIFAFYVENLVGCGLDFAKTARELARQGKYVVVHKAGRTEEGAKATATHTGAEAGLHERFLAVMKQAGVYVVDKEERFDIEPWMLAQYASMEKVPSGIPKLWAMTNAGYRKCSIADHVSENGKHLLDLEGLEQTTYDAVGEILAAEPYKIKFVEITNPVDGTPILDDVGYKKVMDTLANDPKCDALHVDIVADTSQLNSLEKDPSHQENMELPDSVISACEDLWTTNIKRDPKYQIPMVFSINVGEAFDPAVKRLREEGLPVFRYADNATEALGRVMEHRQIVYEMSRTN